MSTQVEPGRYRHFKGGCYDVVAVAARADGTGHDVVYRACVDGTWWVRDVAEFTGPVPGGVARFEREDDAGTLAVPAEFVDAAWQVLVEAQAGPRPGWTAIRSFAIRTLERAERLLAEDLRRRLRHGDDPLDGRAGPATAPPPAPSK